MFNLTTFSLVLAIELTVLSAESGSDVIFYLEKYQGLITDRARVY